MKTNIESFFLLLFFTISSYFSSAQTLSLPKEIKSPNAASLGMFGDIPVSYFTGRANVNIPLFSDEVNGIPLNIDLNYDSGGVQVNSLPSWIGQNWNMNAGGVISRTIQGSVDEAYFPGPGYLPIYGYFYNHNYLNSASWSQQGYMHALATSSPTSNYDLEPDIFSFNFMGMSGKFFLGQDGSYKVQSSSNIKVVINMAENQLILGRNTYYPFQQNEGMLYPAPKTIFKITLIDEKGISYIFGNNQNAIEYSQNNFWDYNSGVLATSWYLSTVKDRLGNVIYSFEYDRGDYQAKFYLTASSTFSNNVNNCSYSTTTPLTCSGALIIPSYLKKITTKNGTVVNFNRSVSSHMSINNTNAHLNAAFTSWESTGAGPTSSGWTESRFYLLYHDNNENLQPLVGYYRDDIFNNKLKYYKLDNITVYVNGNFDKTISLNRNSNVAERLNLTGVSINGQNSPTPLTYTFSYNNFGQLPQFVTKSIDHWGFYKGGTGFSENLANHYAQREPNASYMQIGALTQIIYPTKGSTLFEYEPHNYIKYVNENLGLTNETNIAGGLRVSKIITRDGNTERVKQIKYVSDLSNNISSGILGLKNKYNWPSWSIATSAGGIYVESNFSINSMIPGSNFSGSHIGYSKVYEIEAGNGSTSYEYTNYGDFPDANCISLGYLANSMYSPHLNNDFKRGLPKKISSFSEVSSTSPIKTVENFYKSMGSYKSRGFKHNAFFPCNYPSGPNPEPNFVATGNAYEIDYADFVLDYSVESNFLNGNAISTTSTPTFSIYPVNSTFYGDTFIKSETKDSSINDTVTNFYYYPNDFAATTEFTSLLGQHYFPIIETIESIPSTTISKVKMFYTMQIINGASIPMLTKTQTAKGNAYEDKTFIDKYDNDGNILEYHQNDGIHNSFLYVNNLLLYKVTNAAWNEYTVGTNFTSFNSNLNKSVTKYTYNSYRDLQSITFPNGLTESYTYDLFRRLQTITDNNNKLVKRIEYNIK